MDVPVKSRGLAAVSLGSWLLLALATTPASAATPSGTAKGPGQQGAKPSLGAPKCKQCTCCIQTDAKMRTREATLAMRPQEAVKAQGERLLSYRKLSDAEAIERDLASIARRTAAPAAPKSRGRVEATAPVAAPRAAAPTPARAVAGFTERRVPDPFGGFLARRGFARKHGPWHAVHNADRLSAEELRFVEQTLGWTAPRDPQGRLIKQEGMKDNGYKFLGMHGGMVEGATQANVAQGVIRPFTKAEWTRLKPALRQRNPEIANGMQMVMDLLAAYDKAVANGTAATPGKTKIGTLFQGYDDSLDVFGNWMQTTQRRDTNAARLGRLPAKDRQLVAKTAGLHNLVHVVLADANSQIDMGNPDLNLYNDLFWLHHGTIEKAKEVFYKWYASPRDRREYDRVQQEERTLMDVGTAQGQRMMRDIRKLERHSFSPGDRELWRSIQSKISPEATLRADGAL